jgi:GTP-sensing pleiotropic transcriptional regulator CodY
MTNKYIISRPVYTKLLDKLEKYKLAEVIKQGVKGTYIKFTNIDLISESKKYLKE